MRNTFSALHGGLLLSGLLLLLPVGSLMGQTPQPEGLPISVSQPISVKTKGIRVLLPFKAEAGTNDQAVERLAEHMNSIRSACMELGAIPESISFANPETSPVNMLQSIRNMANGGQNVWMGNGAPNAVFAVQAQPAMPVRGGALPPIMLDMAHVRGTPQEQSKALPQIFVATSVAAADWDVEGKSWVENANLKSKLSKEIAKRHLDGKELVHKFTSEQEDEIFELTKIDIRNGDTKSMFATQPAPPKFQFFGSIPEQEYNEALKKGFKAVQTQAKQIASNCNLKLGKLDYLDIQIESKPSSNSASVLYSPYPAVPDAVPRMEWEPSNATGSYRAENPNQLNKVLVLKARFKLD